MIVKSPKKHHVSFVDIRKAFDTVEHNLLWYKLQRIGVRGKFLTAIQSLYNEVKCTVRVNNDLAYPVVQCGDRSKTGLYTVPTLFSVYINDLADRINCLNCGVPFDDFCLSLLLYADDIALIVPNENSLQCM